MVSMFLNVGADQDEAHSYMLAAISQAGYAITAANDRSRTITYQASGGAWAWGQTVKLDFNKAPNGCTLLVTVNSKKSSLTEGGQQRELAKWVAQVLSQKFEVTVPSASPSQDADPLPAAPGASSSMGCVTILALAGVGLVGLGSAVSWLV